MLNEIKKQLIIGAIIYLVGGIIYTLMDAKAIGNVIIYGSGAYIIVSLSILLFQSPFLKKAIAERKKNQAYDDLLKYKKLLNEGILSQDEFDIKSEELKKYL